MALDLHCHSIYSDGALPPEEIIDTAIELGLSAISITDHDNILAYDYAQAQLRKRSEENRAEIGLEIIPGIEVNTIHNNKEVHILGYYYDIEDKGLQDLIQYQQHARIQQITEIVKLLNKVARIKVTMEDIVSLTQPGGSIGRPHIAKAVVNAGGTSNVIEAYKKYINDQAPTYIQRKTVSPHEAVETIYEAKGIPVMAHPHDLVEAEGLVKDLMNCGLRGLEVYHRRHSPAMIEYFSSISEKYGLIMTGGSDCHGTKVSSQLFLGRTHVPEWVLSELKKEKNRLEIASG